MATHYFPRSREPSAVAARAEALLHRYPNLSEAELAELINLMPSVPILDFGLMTADPAMSGRLEAFYEAHGRNVRQSFLPVTVFLMLPLAIAAALTWWAMS